MVNNFNKVEKKTFYITTTLPYVNAEPHIGFSYELVIADIIGRYKETQGYDVFFNTGTDEYGSKIYKAAKEKKQNTKEYADELSQGYLKHVEILGIKSDVNFIRTTDASHQESVLEFWKRCKKAGYIYLDTQEIKYCAGCEMEKTDSDLENGKCHDHPNLNIEIRKEENYFFKLSSFEAELKSLYEKNPDFIIPESRYEEARKFVKRGLKDFSISRLKDKMPWGMPVPDDPNHVMYVWFDALINYISAIEWPSNMAKFEKFWPVIQFAGKDQLRQQSIMWQAMLKSIGIQNSKQIVIHGFITSGGKKMSKSLGNVINPFQLIEQYGTDAVRYFLSRHINPFEDTDVTEDSIKEAYNANLANGLGNLVSRIMKMASQNLKHPILIKETDLKEIEDYLNKYNIQSAVNKIWSKISDLDNKIQSAEPFKLLKSDQASAVKVIEELVSELAVIAKLLSFIMPSTSEKILGLIKNNIFPNTPLFLRK